ncbi:putative Golgi/lysosome glycoprotein 1 [Trypanosoma cruzi]|uniref:Putative Golgi/lysosome glycoprotein 1 n=1 Tax=Trypanosoma cruzi TaxID=5693 RepID=A0A2V2XB03_TRYCR|nr:putative Golgi/lysosome glycoprotein 1 [Trypanosoma cruzi]
MKTSLFLALLLFSVCCPVVQGGNLYPRCQGEELLGTADAGEESIFFKIRRYSKALTLTCLAYEVISISDVGRGERDPCQVEHQTEYQYRLVIRATMVDEATGKIIETDYDVKGLAGGSLGDLLIHSAELSKFSLVFMNKATNVRCRLRIRALMSYTERTKPFEREGLPVVIGLEPTSVYRNRSSTTKLFLSYPSGTNMQEAQSDVVKLTNLEKECADEHSQGHAMRPQPTPQSMEFIDDTSLVGLRDYYFDSSETLRICYHKKGKSVGAELAIVRVFECNPYGYEVVKGQDDEGRVYVGVETTIKFYGYDLDTRDLGDRAKFANDFEDCATAPPAGGVPEGLPLAPAESYGPGTRYTLWTWVLREGGFFKVCYKTRDGAWVEVPNIIDVAYDAPSTYAPGSSSPPSIPRPRDPITQEECPMAIERPGEPWTVYKSLKLTFNESKISEEYLLVLSRAFCIPRSALAVTRMTHDGEGHQVIYLSILCEELGDAAPCDTVERQNYILTLGKSNSTILSDIGILSVEGSRHLFAFGDDTVTMKGTGGRVMTLLITCATVVLVAAMAVYGVLKYRENRQYFIQFGNDDAEVEDMYAASDPRNTEHKGPLPVKDAVIEVEE